MDVDIEVAETTAESTEKHWRIGTLTYGMAGIVTLFLLLLAGDFIWSLRERSVVPVAQVLFKKFGASDFLNGLMIMSLPCMIGVLLCPVISYRSDRHRGRWGRRIPYLFATIPVVMIGMLGMASSPLLGKYCVGLVPSVAYADMVLILFGLSWTLFEFGAVAGNVVFGALINDVVPHELLGRFYGLFRIMSLSAGFIFNYWFLGLAEAHHSWLFLGLGLIYGLGFAWMCLKVKEGGYPQPEAPAGSTVAASVTYLRECFSSGYYWQIFALLTVAGLVFMPVNMFGIFYAQKLDVSLDHYGKFIAGSYVVSFILSYPLGMLADKFHPLRCGMAILAVYALTSTVSGIFITGEKTFVAAVIIHCVVSGMYFTLTASLPMRLLPRSRFAQFGSAAGIVASLANITAAPAVGSLLDRTGHDYRYTYFMGTLLALVTLGIALVFYRRFKMHGGPYHYVAPE